MITMDIDELDISPEVKRGLADRGFTEMFPIQEQAIPPMLEGANIIGQAKTGTGKTAAFGVPRADPGAGGSDRRRPLQLR